VGRFDGFAMRVPTINVSVVDLTFMAKRPTSVDEINAILKSVVVPRKWMALEPTADTQPDVHVYEGHPSKRAWCRWRSLWE